MYFGWDVHLTNCTFKIYQSILLEIISQDFAINKLELEGREGWQVKRTTWLVMFWEKITRRGMKALDNGRVCYCFLHRACDGTERTHRKWDVEWNKFQEEEASHWAPKLNSGRQSLPSPVISVCLDNRMLVGENCCKYWLKQWWNHNINYQQLSTWFE